MTKPQNHVVHERSNIMKAEGITLKELTDSLNKLCTTHPELQNCIVAVATESGYSGAYINSPITLYTYNNFENNTIHIFTDDDIFITDTNCTFYTT